MLLSREFCPASVCSYASSLVCLQFALASVLRPTGSRTLAYVQFMFTSSLIHDSSLRESENRHHEFHFVNLILLAFLQLYTFVCFLNFLTSSATSSFLTNDFRKLLQHTTTWLSTTSHLHRPTHHILPAKKTQTTSKALAKRRP